MGIIPKKKPKVTIEKGVVQDKNGKKFNIDFAGENDDFVVISHAEEKNKIDESIKDLLKQNENNIYDICFINNYSYLLVGCEKGLLYVYKRIINGKSNLKFEEIAQFQPHEKSIIQITLLQSGHILTLSSDSSSKILEIDIDTNDVLYKNETKCDEVQLLLEENETSNNSAVELESGNLIISQGQVINFFVKIQNMNDMPLNGSLQSKSKLNKEFYLAKTIFTNSDNIFFVEIDSKTVAASQLSIKKLLFYNVENYTLIQSVDKIEFSNMKNCMCLINKETLAIGGNNGSIYLVNTSKRQLFLVTHFENCSHISCIKNINNDTIIMGCEYMKNNYDIIVYKVNYNENKVNFQEIKRTQKVHKKMVNDIKLITRSISQNNNPFIDQFNVVTLGLDYKVYLLLKKKLNEKKK